MAEARKATVKKAVAKKAAVKKTTAKKTVAKKTVAKKTVAKKTVAKKTVAKKAPAKKAAIKKTVAKRTSATSAAWALARESRTRLMDFLDETQQKELLGEGTVTLTGSDGRKYQIDVRRYSGNVMLIDNRGYNIRAYCAHTQTAASHAIKSPDGLMYWYEENAITQFLTLKYDADKFLRVAR